MLRPQPSSNSVEGAKLVAFQKQVFSAQRNKPFRCLWNQPFALVLLAGFWNTSEAVMPAVGQLEIYRPIAGQCVIWRFFATFGASECRPAARAVSRSAADHRTILSESVPMIRFWIRNRQFRHSSVSIASGGDSGKSKSSRSRGAAALMALGL